MAKINKTWGISSRETLTKPKRVISRSFDHVVSPDNIFLHFISRFENIPFKFTFSNMENGKMFNSLAKLIFKVFSAVKGGTIIFLPSYAFLIKVKIAFQSLFSSEHSLEGVVFFDEKKKNSEENNNTKKTLRQGLNAFELFKLTLVGLPNSQFVSKPVRRRTQARALLFSVMGGSLSEGINFKDILARSIIVVGQPYPSINNSSLKAKMEYFSSAEFSSRYLGTENSGNSGDTFTA